MHKLEDIPKELSAFFIWLRRATTVAWQQFQTFTLEDFENQGVGGLSWRTGTSWKRGLTDDELATIQTEWGMDFPADYQLFLKTLNCPDKRAVSAEWQDEPPYAMAFDEDVSVFSDWSDYPGDINAVMDDLHAHILEDVQSGRFRSSTWSDLSGQTDPVGSFLSALNAAPPLIPVTGHRFLLFGSRPTTGPILSVLGTDAIVYADGLRSLLLLEFAGLLGLDVHAIRAQMDLTSIEETLSDVPFWGDLVLRSEP